MTDPIERLISQLQRLSTPSPASSSSLRLSNSSLPELTGSDNYHAWEEKVEALLDSNGLWKVNPQNPRLSSPADHKDARSTIVLSIHNSLIHVYDKVDSAPVIWFKLKELYDSKSNARAVQQLFSLVNFGFSNSRDKWPDDFVRARSLVTKLKSSLGEATLSIDNLAPLLLLNVFPKSLLPLKVAIENGDTIPDLNLLESKMQNNSSAPVMHHANAVRQASNNKFMNKYKENPCQVCVAKGVTRTWHEPYSKYCAFASLNKGAAVSTYLELSFPCLLDSGASVSMTPNLSLLSDIEEKESIIFLADARPILSTHCGILKLSVTLQIHCLYVQTLETTLVSVAQVVEKGCTVSFKNTKWFIHNNHTNICGSNDFGNGEPKCSLTWLGLHSRLGHPSLGSVQRTAAQYGIIPTGDIHDIPSCKSCIRAKSSRGTFCLRDQNHRIQPGKAISFDICYVGPPDRFSNRHLLIGEDLASKYVWCIPIQSRDAAATEIILILKQLQNQFGAFPHTVRTDNEFNNAELLDFIHGNGIQQELTVPYTSAQNGACERTIQTIMGLGRACLAESGMSQDLWTAACQHATFGWNRTTSKLTGISPYEGLFGRQPDLKLLIPFGQHCFIHVLPHQRSSKLSDRAVPGIIIGYCVNRKGYEVIYDLDSAEVHVVAVQDVVISRTKLLFPSIESTSQSTELPNTVTSITFDNTGSYSDDNHPPLVHSTTEDEVSDISALNSSVTSSSESSNYNNELPVAVLTDSDEASSRIIAEQIRSSIHPLNIIPGERSTRSTRNLNFLNFAQHNPRVHSEEQRIEHAFMVLSKRSESSPSIPLSYKQSQLSPDRVRWAAAQTKELDAMKHFHVYDVVELPGGKQHIPTKWVYDLKPQTHTAELLYKARLVVLGCKQRQGVDYSETFAPVVRFSTLRIVLALSASFDLNVHHMDVSNAFLNADLTDEVYLKLPEGYRLSDQHKNLKTPVWRLRKALYGLKQSPRLWHQEVDLYLVSYGFVPSKLDPCLYTMGSLLSNNVLCVLLFVDDLLICGHEVTSLAKFKSAISSKYRMKDLGEAHRFLGFEIARNRSKKLLTISQASYITEILASTDLSEIGTVTSPMDRRVRLTSYSGQATAGEITEYQRLVGCLNYLVVGSRPDLAYAVNIVSKFSCNPSSEHLLAVQKIMKYVSLTQHYAIRYHSEVAGVFQPTAYCDANHGGQVKNNLSIPPRSQSGMIFLMAGGPVIWKSSRQSETAANSYIAEFKALMKATAKARFLFELLYELKLPVQPITIHQDNQSVIATAKTFSQTQLDFCNTEYHVIKEHIERNMITLIYCPGSLMIADALTKGSFGPGISKFCCDIGLCPNGGSVDIT